MRMVSEEHERIKVAAYMNPTPEAAMQFWDADMGPPPRDEVLLAGLHKGRLRWEHSTPSMIEESTRWLLEHGFRVERDRRPFMNQ